MPEINTEEKNTFWGLSPCHPQRIANSNERADCSARTNGSLLETLTLPTCQQEKDQQVNDNFTYPAVIAPNEPITLTELPLVHSRSSSFGTMSSVTSSAYANSPSATTSALAAKADSSRTTLAMILLAGAFLLGSVGMMLTGFLVPAAIFVGYLGMGLAVSSAIIAFGIFLFKLSHTSSIPRQDKQGSTYVALAAHLPLSFPDKAKAAEPVASNESDEFNVIDLPNVYSILKNSKAAAERDAIETEAVEDEKQPCLNNNH